MIWLVLFGLWGAASVALTPQIGRFLQVSLRPPQAADRRDLSSAAAPETEPVVLGSKVLPG